MIWNAEIVEAAALVVSSSLLTQYAMTNNDVDAETMARDYLRLSLVMIMMVSESVVVGMD